MSHSTHFGNDFIGQMSMSTIDFYSTNSRGISTALCVLSGSTEIDSSSAIV